MLGCIEYMRNEKDTGRRDQIEEKLREEGFFKAGLFAAYYVQGETMFLKPWQCPPAHVTPGPLDGPHNGYEREAIPFLRLMLEAGISKYCADPLKEFAKRGLELPTIERTATDSGMLDAAEKVLAGLSTARPDHSGS